MGDKNLKEVKLKIAFAIFLTLCYRTTAASGLTQGNASVKDSGGLWEKKKLVKQRN